MIVFEYVHKSLRVSICFSFAASWSNYLICYADNYIFVYAAATAEWIQTIPLKQARPLSRDGLLMSAPLPESNLILMHHIHDKEPLLRMLPAGHFAKRGTSMVTKKGDKAERLRSQRSVDARSVSYHSLSIYLEYVCDSVFFFNEHDVNMC